jgi:hypothetical protein
MSVNRLTATERAQRALDRQDDKRVNALYAQGAPNRLAPKPEVVAPKSYVVKVLPSAMKRKAAATKAAATRRQRKLAQG